MSSSPRRHTVLLPRTKFRWNRTIDRWVMAKKEIFRMAAAAILNFKYFNFGNVSVIGFNIWCRVPNFIKIGRFLTEIWRFNDFQNGGRPPSLILKICSFCHVALVYIPFCFLVQNFAEIGQSVDELWPKNRFSRWRCSGVSSRYCYGMDCYGMATMQLVLSQFKNLKGNSTLKNIWLKVKIYV